MASVDYLVELVPTVMLATICRECRSKRATVEVIVSAVHAGTLMVETRTPYCGDCAEAAKTFMHDNCWRRLYGWQAS